MLLSNRGSFYTGMSFISFSCLNTLSRTSSMMLNRSGENRYPNSFSNIEEKPL